MSFYRDRIFPRIMNRVTNTEPTRRIRDPRIVGWTFRGTADAA